ncbi:hypothetical protein [Pseudoalteromonas sp.]|uniref:hypothetical protein n=1 Tax=Pseudoalteromonas sp. TaxID=53249 RepID=UPI00262D2CCE|nr:hypothetical protein [Pseudoalteromonas sp.]MCP4587306.1 hypothetical protein [Pseudoalteromonas sp.]
MIFKDIKPDLIYVELQSVIKDLINTIDASEVETTDKEIAKFSRNILNELDANIASELDKLKVNSEWNTFTVAFYGETNAGKSTIIETLRILLLEPQKVSSQKKFNELVTSLNIDSASFEKIKKEIVELKDNKTILEQSLNSVKDKSNEQLSNLKNELATLSKTIESKLAAFNIFQKMWHFFSKLPEEAQLVTKQEQFENTKLILDENVAQVESEVTENDERYNAACLQLDHMQGELEKLVPYADGAIIGDGRSDYTLDSQSYSMQGDESTFTVLDVPGIEGKEEKVRESIWSAVHKAHAVFYVTSKAAPPQTGDDKNKGTLEKIKEHLGDQTEVYSIYNKRITNPLQLQKSQLVSDSELASLAELDTKMTEQLGENYQGTKSLCGLVGYLAAANCLVAGSADHKRKEKFLKDNNEQYLLDYCGFTELKQFLVCDLIKDHKVKIIKANFNKANQVLKGVCGSITALRDEKFEPLHNKLNQEIGSASGQLDIALSSLKSRLLASVGTSVDKFKSSVRKSVYSEIENNISNDDFKYELKSSISRAQSQFDDSLPEAINIQLNEFGKEVNFIVERFQKHAGELLDAYSSFETNVIASNFSISVDIDKGFNVAGIIGSVVGAVALAFSGVGIAALAIGAVGVVISFAKSIGSLFNSSYKMSQQKKTTDDNIYKIAGELESTAKTNIDEAFKELEENIDTIKFSLKTPIEHTALINKILSISIENLYKTSRQLDKEL